MISKNITCNKMSAQKRTHLPRPGDTIRQEYLNLVRDIDIEINRLSISGLQEVIQCKPGCYDCCINFSVFAVEAALIAEQLEDHKVQIETGADFCGLLKGTHCSVYPYRPIICRTQGLPLGYIDEESGMVEISACNLNFAEDYQFKEDEVLFMDDFNACLLEINRKYCKSIAVEPLLRIALKELVRYRR